MLRSVRNLIERQVQKARAEGQLDGLEGEGKPLPDRSGEANDPALAAGMRIMAQAGVKPEEFDLKEELSQARREYLTLTDLKEKKAAMIRIADLDMRYNLARDARRRFLR